jgi:hypothetical protein
VQSPFTRRAASLGSRTVLSCTDTSELLLFLLFALYQLIFNNVILVPIYDARESEEEFPSVLKSLQELPQLDEEMTPGSCAIVGYTANTFFRRNSRMKSVSFNIHFAVLLGEGSL